MMVYEPKTSKWADNARNNESVVPLVPFLSKESPPPPLKEGCSSRVYSFYAGGTSSPSPSPSSFPPPRVASFYARVTEWRRCVYPPLPPSLSHSLSLSLVLISSRRWSRRSRVLILITVRWYTAAIKSIAVFGCDIDHTGVGKITKLFPRLELRYCSKLVTRVTLIQRSSRAF